jgi:hypothetical protein
MEWNVGSLAVTRREGVERKREKVKPRTEDHNVINKLCYLSKTKSTGRVWYICGVPMSISVIYI